MYRFNSANMRQFYSNELYATMIPSIVERINKIVKADYHIYKKIL